MPRDKAPRIVSRRSRLILCNYKERIRDHRHTVERANFMVGQDAHFPVVRFTLGLAREYEAQCQAQGRRRSPATVRRQKTAHGNMVTSDLADELHHRRRHSQSVHPVLVASSSPNKRHPRTTSANLSSGQVLAERYEIIKLCGRGNFSCTYLAKDILQPMAPLVVIKVLKAGCQALGKHEYELLQRLHSGIADIRTRAQLPLVQPIASFSLGASYHIVLEALDPRGLYLDPCDSKGMMCYEAPVCHLCERALRNIAINLLHGVGYLHTFAKVIHGDLKAENILRTLQNEEPTFKIIDMGNAVPFESVQSYYADFNLQSANYRAPEVG